MQDDDLAAFHAAVADITPLPASGRVLLSTPTPPPRPLKHTAAHSKNIAPGMALQDRLEDDHSEASYLRPSMAHKVLRELRQGRWRVEDEIDLHGLNRDEARHLLANFLVASLNDGKRCIRIVHGKGLSSPQRQSILRQLVRGWLSQRIEVLAYCPAKPQDGGEGALLALLHAAKNKRQPELPVV